MMVDDDPAPQPPVRPSIDDCCRSGCVPCVFDLYEEAMERYRIELKAWGERHAAGRRHAERSFYPAKTNDKI
jgi:hypothetical protein